MIFYSSIFILIAVIKPGICSAGDKSKFYNDCLQICEEKVCAKGLHKPVLKTLFDLDLTLWTCKEDCEYDCQWQTVKSFYERKWPTPQFYGKWPFIRYFGLQEPASAIFSICNFLVVLSEYNRLKNELNHESPYFKLWISFSFVCLNCWFWSAIYHIRDSDLSERLDYISASVLVFTSFYCMTVRTLKLKVSSKSIVWSIICACVLLNHCAYLWFYPFDYSYNMLFNIVVGSLAVAGWMLWSAIAIKQGHPCSILVAAYSVLMAVSTLLELFDFPPYFWIFDAHSLWHLSTCFIIQIFFTFIRQDSHYLTSISGYKLPRQYKTE